MINTYCYHLKLKKKNWKKKVFQNDHSSSFKLFLTLELLSIECRKTTAFITLTNQNRGKQGNERIIIKSKYM